MLTQPVRKLRSGTCIWYAALSAGSNLLPLKPHPLQDGEEPGEERRVRNTQGFPSGGDGQSPAQKRREWVGGILAQSVPRSPAHSETCRYCPWKGNPSPIWGWVPELERILEEEFIYYQNTVCTVAFHKCLPHRSCFSDFLRLVGGVDPAGGREKEPETPVVTQKLAQNEL